MADFYAAHWPAFTPPLTSRSLRHYSEYLMSGAFAVCHVGWSRKENRCVGYIYNSDDGFQSHRLGAGHMMMPAPWTGAPDYAELAARWEPAARGEGTEAFHLALAKNQFAAFEQGLFVTGAACGGELHTARIDAEGITVRTAHEFPNYRPTLDVLRRNPQGRSLGNIPAA